MGDKLIAIRVSDEGIEVNPTDLDPHERAELEAMEHQQRLIRAKFGDSADSANYGKAVIEEDGGVVIMTRVYGHGNLTTSLRYDAPTDYHDEWEFE